MSGIDIVTGGCGFIGSHLVEALIANGRDVWVIDKSGKLIRDAYRQSQKDISYTSLDFEGVDTVYHLAALADIIPSIENPRDYYETNVTGTFNVLEAARKAGCKKFIYAASASCYGDVGAFPTTENTVENPRYPYALTKYLGEQLVMHWSKVYKIPAISLRLFNVYGLRHRTSGAYGAMFGTFLAQKANGKPLTIVGDGHQERDFVHVSDVVDAFIKAADSDCQGIYNVGTGSPESVNYIAKIIGGETVHIPKRPGEPDITCANISKIKRELGWIPKVGIEEGIKELLEHLEDYKDAPVWESETIAKATEKWFEVLA